MMIARLVHGSLPRDIGAILNVATASHARAVMFLVVLSLVSFLPGFFNIPPTDRDESRFAQATRQMIESGDYIDIRFQDEVRYKKPVGIYWLQAAAVTVGASLGVREAHTTIWLYRIPSLLGAIGAVLLTYWAALAFVSRRIAYSAALMMATCVLLAVEARLAKTDAVLLACCVAAMGVMARAYLGRSLDRDISWTHAFMLWTGIAVGILVKGPLILMVAGLATIALCIADRSGRWLLRLRPAPGIIWVLLLVLPWFLAIIAKSGESFLQESVGQDLFGKLLHGQESHGAPPGFYLLLFWLTFWPAAPLAAIAVPAVWRERRLPPVRFLLAWIVPSWIVFELVATKLPHYILPLYPAIAILIARAIEQRSLSHNPHVTRLTVTWPFFSALLPAAGIVLLIWLRGQFGWVGWPAAAVSAIFGFYAWRLYDIEGAERSLQRAAIAALCMTFAVLGVAVPLMGPVFPGRQLAELIQLSGCRNPVVAAAGYHEPSLVFLVGTNIHLVDGADAAEILKQGDCRLAIIESRQERAFAQRAERNGLRYSLRGRLEGNYNINSGGRSANFAIYRSEPTQ